MTPSEQPQLGMRSTHRAIERSAIPKPAAGLRERARAEVHRLCEEIRMVRYVTYYNLRITRGGSRDRVKNAAKMKSYPGIHADHLNELIAELRSVLKIARLPELTWDDIPE